MKGSPTTQKTETDMVSAEKKNKIGGKPLKLIFPGQNELEIISLQEMIILNFQRNCNDFVSKNS